MYRLKRSLDLDEKGYVGEDELRSLLGGKSGLTAEDVEEMITEYRALGHESNTEDEAVIYYKGK